MNITSMKKARHEFYIQSATAEGVLGELVDGDCCLMRKKVVGLIHIVV